MILTKDKGQRMWGGGFGTGSGGSGGGGGSFDPSMLAGYATEQWTEENYVSKDYFNQIFELQYNHRVLTKNGDIVISDVVTAMVAAPNAIIDTTTHTTTDSETGYTILTSNTVTGIKAKAGLWTEQYLSALGQNAGGGGGGTTLNEPLSSINSAGLAAPGAGQDGMTVVWDNSEQKWKYGSAGGGGSTAWSDITGKPSTIAGYGIVDAKIVSGTITLGANSITPLTSSDISDMATQTWVGQQGFLTSVAFSDLTSHPTTLSGYGITDAYTKTEADAKYMTIAAFENLFAPLNSSGNAVSHPYSLGVASIKALFGLWTEEYLSALGQDSGGGGGVTLNEPLQSINSAGLGTPSQSGVAIMWNGSAWTYQVPGGGGGGGGTVTSVGMSVPTGFSVSGQPVTGSGTIAITFGTGYSLPLTADVTKGVTAYGWGDHAQAGYLTSSDLNGYATRQWVGQQGYLTSSDISDMATQTWVVQQGFLTGSSSIAFSQLPTLYWANVQVSNVSNNATSPQFANLTLRNGSATYGSTLYFGDSGAYITEYSEDYLIFNAENGHKFTTMDFEPLEITGSGYVYIKSDGYYGNGLRIGDALLQWDSTNNALKVIKADGTAGNLYATGGISSLGMQSGGGSGATALSDLVDVAISSPTNGQVLMYNNTTGKWYNGTVQQSGGTVTSITAGTGLTGGTITTSGTISLTDQVQTAIANGVTAYGWGNHANAGYLTSSDIADMATQTWVGQQGFLTGSSAIAFSQLPTLYWANVQVSNVSNNATSPQFANLTLRNGSATYGSTLYFGDHGAYIVEYSEDYLIYNAENGHKFSTMDYEPLEITGSGYVYVKSDGSYGNGLRIGDALLKWDSVNNALKVIKADGTAGNLYATGGVSALGMSAGTSALDAMTFNYLTAANRLYIGDTSSYIYNDTTDIRIKPEGDVVLDGRTWMRGHVYMVGGKYIYLSATSTTGRIYLSSDVYLYTDGSDLKINISGTEYKLYKISV